MEENNQYLNMDYASKDWRISPPLSEEIHSKLKKVRENPLFYEHRKKKISMALSTIGDIYSFWIENPELRKSLLLENRSPKTVKKMARKGIQNIKNAWNYLEKGISSGEGFVQSLSPEILKRTNRLVEPLRNSEEEYRVRDVTLNLKNYTPPSWEKVPQKVDLLIDEVKSLYEKNPLESAISFHLGCASIQPFIEGNKRTGRLIQNRILAEADIPVGVISAGEGKYYLGLVSKAIPNYAEGEIVGQREFFNYCASKINNTLDDILGDLDFSVKRG